MKMKYVLLLETGKVYMHKTVGPKKIKWRTENPSTSIINRIEAMLFKVSNCKGLNLRKEFSFDDI